MRVFVALLPEASAAVIIRVFTLFCTSGTRILSVFQMRLPVILPPDPPLIVTETAHQVIRPRIIYATASIVIVQDDSSVITGAVVSCTVMTR